MYQCDYISNNNFSKPNYYLKTNQMTENKSLSNLTKLEQDIFTLINYIRKNPLEFCNNLIQKNKNKANIDQNEIINFLNKILFHYKKNHSLNLKELEPSKKNLRARLSKYGERTGKIFERFIVMSRSPNSVSAFHLRSLQTLYRLM